MTRRERERRAARAREALGRKVAAEKQGYFPLPLVPIRPWGGGLRLEAEDVYRSKGMPVPAET